jgi:hypothetical protein
MGAATSFLDKFTGDSENERKARDRAKLVYKECESENTLFYETVLHSNVESNKMLPISAVLFRKFFIKIVSNTDSQKLANNGLNQFIGDVANSQIADAIGSILQTAVTALLSNKSMSVSKKIGYSLSIGKLGGVERMDFMLVNRTYNSKSWTEKMENVMSGVFVISSVDVTKLKGNDATVLVQNCFKNESLMIQANIKQLLNIALFPGIKAKDIREKQRAIIDELKKLYEEQRLVGEKTKKAILPEDDEEEERRIKKSKKSRKSKSRSKSARKGKKSKSRSRSSRKNKKSKSRSRSSRKNKKSKSRSKSARKNKKSKSRSRSQRKSKRSRENSCQPDQLGEEHPRLDRGAIKHLMKSLIAGAGGESEESYLRKTLADSSNGEFEMLEEYLKRMNKRRGHRVDYEHGALLSASLVFYSAYSVDQGNYGRAAYGLWHAWRNNPENLEVNLILEEIGIFVPLNLDHVTLKLTVYCRKYHRLGGDAEQLKKNFFKKIGGAFKKVTNVVKQASKIAGKVLNNPIVGKVAGFIPGGAQVLATAKQVQGYVDTATNIIDNVEGAINNGGIKGLISAAPGIIGDVSGMMPGRKPGASPGRKPSRSPGRRPGLPPGRKPGVSPGRTPSRSPQRRPSRSPRGGRRR